MASNTAQPLAHLNAIHLRHIDVEQDQVKLILSQQVQSGDSANGGHRVVVGAFERHLICHVADAIIVHQQNAGSGGEVKRPRIARIEQAAEAIHRLNQSLDGRWRHRAIRSC